MKSISAASLGFGKKSARQFGYMENGIFTPISVPPGMSFTISDYSTKRRYDSSVSDASDVEPNPSPEKKSKMDVNHEFVQGSSRDNSGGKSGGGSKGKAVSSRKADSVIDIPSDSDSD